MHTNIDAPVVAILRLPVTYATGLLWTVGILLLIADDETTATGIIAGDLISHVGLMRLAELES